MSLDLLCQYRFLEELLLLDLHPFYLVTVVVVHQLARLANHVYKFHSFLVLGHILGVRLI